MKKAVIIFLAAVSAAGAMFFVRQFQDERAEAAKLEAEILKGLTAEEINLILKSEAAANPDSVAQFKESAEKRHHFLRGIKEYLALAAQARRENLTEDSNFQVNVEYKKNILLAGLYEAKLVQGKERSYVVPEEETRKLWANPENERLFSRDMNVLQEIRRAALEAAGNRAPVSALQGDMLEKARKNWAKTKILSGKAKADAEFIDSQEIGLRIRIVEAGILANDYLRLNWEKRIKASDGEIAEYLAEHPEYDLSGKKQTAETVLQKAKAGEDFAALAARFSEDRATKDKGGLYENVAQNTLWAEVEHAALALEKGQIAERIIESAFGFHIVKLEKKHTAKTPDGGEKVKFSVRHIVLQKSFEEPNNKIPGVPPPFMTAREIAKTEVEKEKREKFIAEIFARNPISMPEDFPVELPDAKGFN